MGHQLGDIKSSIDVLYPGKDQQEINIVFCEDGGGGRYHVLS